MTCGSLWKSINMGILLITITLPAVSLAQPNKSCPDKAQAFWKEFRQAALQPDITTLANMVHFPLEVRGTLDDSPSRQINKDEFNKILPELLATDPGMSAIPTTMKNYIQDIETVQKKACNKRGSQFRVGSWVFVKKNSNWLLVQAFVEE